MIKKIIFIVLALMFIILLVNRIDTTKPIVQNIEKVTNVIGCQDYSYKFHTNVPVDVVFTVTKSNGEDALGFFKSISASGTYDTILHCGNDYHVVYSSPGYNSFEEDVSNTGFRPMFETTKQITLTKIL